MRRADRFLRIALTEKANRLLGQLERDSHLLTDAELADAIDVLDGALEEIAVLEREAEREVEDAERQTRRRLPAGAITRKSLTPDDAPRPRFRQCGNRWYEICLDGRCHRVADKDLLRWLEA